MTTSLKGIKTKKACRKIISNLVKEITAKYVEELREEDRRETERIAAGGCSHCGGVLHVANYPSSLVD